MDLYTAIVVITVGLLIVTIVDIRHNRIINSKMKKYSILVCLLIGVSLFCEWVGVKTNGANVSLIGVHNAAKLIEFCLAPLICAVVAISYSKIKRPRLVAIVTALHIIFEIWAMHYNYVIAVDAKNYYHRGRLYFIYVFVFSASIIYCFVAILREEIRHYAKPAPELLATLIFLAGGIGLQMVYSNLRVDYMCVAIGNYFLYNHRCVAILRMDGLTYLLNRRCYEKDLEKISAPAMLIYMDVNNFKTVNDTYGHAVGDRYLKLVGSLIQEVYGRHGSCYRCGGDEFCVILIKGANKTDELNERFWAKIQQQQKKDGRFPGVSIGFASFNPATDQLKAVIEQADEMMYQTKQKAKIAAAQG